MMQSMKAIQKIGTSIALREIPRPARTSADEVLIRVAAAGVCRTDVYVAIGRIPAADPLVLGHEFSGIIEEAGSASAFSRGERVAVMPLIPCGNCSECNRDLATLCQNRTMLGVDRDGAFAEFVTVPTKAVWRIPQKLSFTEAAYAEPVAAALGVLNAELPAGAKGLIYGKNRFSALVRQVLTASGFTDIDIHDAGVRGGRLADNSYDFAIETIADSNALSAIVRAVRPRGTVVLKSRPPIPIGLDMHTAVMKELTLRGACYGSFKQGIGMMVEGAIDVRGLLGEVHPLEDFQAIFARALEDESTKLFFSPGGGLCAE
ncbi:MAG TPA: alcohol dehydrogenase catalytic domain-containing protein [Tepidisphaeraceae bacterium]|jgi:L-iditol 2-dehydrogenase|nr:alcohol dehydrogenase catalytic domain-containing protein [Tepidisphaeraceae bacterium]